METDTDPPNTMAQLAQLFGASEPALRLLISVLLGYPVAVAHRHLLYGKNKNLQNLFFIVTGLAISYWNYGLDIAHNITAVVVTYATLLLLKSSDVAVGISFIFNLGYLLIGYYTAGTDDYDINWTMPHCVLVLRLIGITFDLYDGRFPNEQLSKENQKVALRELPSFSEFCGFMFFPASALIGPLFSMKRYLEFTGGQYRGEDKNALPDCVWPALRRAGLGVLYLSLFQVGSMFVPDNYLLSDDYYNASFVKKCFLLGLWGKVTLYKYISCWLLAEGACILFGLTYNGKDENNQPLWNGCENVNLALIENPTEFNHYIQSFNLNTNHWVAQYVYKRLKFLGNRYLSQAGALLFLAVWHGFHSGYYVCFFFEFIVVYLERDLQSIIKKNEAVTKFLENSAVRTAVYIVLRIYAFVFMGWCLAPFVLLTYPKYLRVFSAVNYVGALIFIPYPFLYSPVLRVLLRPKRHVD